MPEAEDPGRKYFNCTEAERAVFEAGIKLGSIYHQYVGAPVTEANVATLEKAIEDGARVQPFVEDVRVRIDRKYVRKTKSAYKYVSLKGEMLDVELTVRYGGARARCALKYVEDLDYPLMHVLSVDAPH